MISISCQSVLFDLDGTLVDSMKSVEQAWSTWCREHNIECLDLVSRFAGTPALDIVRTLRPDLDAEKEKAKLDILETTCSEGLSLIPGAREIIDLIPKNRWGIVTSGTFKVASHRLRHVQIDLPNVLINADLLTHGKPHPEGYLKAASMLNTEPAQCLVFEDAPAGIRAARAAGMNVIALSGTFPASHLKNADACIEDFNCVDVSVNGSKIIISLK